MQAGIPTTTIRYLGTIHDFMMLNLITATPAARGAIAQVSTIFVNYLQKLPFVTYGYLLFCIKFVEIEKYY